jgi:hypothetical protein
LRVDFAANGVPLGVEITAPTVVTVTDINAVLIKLGLPAISPEDWAPLRAA